mmetsp:Transcript_14655/g.19128  ORF Transcript_14655/g.19128 Transcript_14655/m.19128 type:complete len:407 (+) Transcript_14655:180-1400(+)
MLSRNVACRLLRQRSCRSLPNSLGREFSQSCDDNNENRDGIRRGRNFSTSVYPKARRQRQRDFFGKEKSLWDMAEENELGLSKFKIRDSIRVGGKDDLRFAHDYSAKVPVRSIYIASNIDLISILSKVFVGSQGSPEHRFSKTSLIVKLQSPSGNSVDEALSAVSPDIFQYVVVFRYGSVVFLNVPITRQHTILSEIKKHCKDPVTAGFEKKDRYDILVKPVSGKEEMDSDEIIQDDYATVPRLDMNYVTVISTIMSQTVALDSYNIIVNELLEVMERINSSIKKNGMISSDEKENLFKVIAQSNTLFNDILTKLRVKERSDTAWNHVEYDRVLEGMKEEFELDERFNHVTFKLNLIQQNVKFFLDILQNQKSTSLEWIIIILIGFECALMLLDMSGLGTVLLSPA